MGGMRLLTGLCLAIKVDPLVLIRCVTEFVTVMYSPVVRFAFIDLKVNFIGHRCST